MSEKLESPICPECGVAHPRLTQDEVCQSVQDHASVLLDQGAEEADVILGLMETAADGFLEVNAVVTLEAWLDLATVIYNESVDARARHEAKQRIAKNGLS